MKPLFLSISVAVILLGSTSCQQNTGYSTSSVDIYGSSIAPSGWKVNQGGGSTSVGYLR
ncbi:MAG: hypothetical protein P1U58_03940 [Verrucomicrobiales bacterium]|nr:hypothetical protein [Verrucomicrobiales bacterium]